MRLNINLPGPFSVSTRITPNIGKSVRQVNRAARTLAQREKQCSRPAQRPGPTNSRPQDRTLTDSGSGGGVFTLWLLGLTLVILAILGLSGFRV